MFPAVPLAGAMPSPPPAGQIEWSRAVDPHWLWCAAIFVGLCAIAALIVFRRRKLALVSGVCLILVGADTALWIWSLRAYTVFEVSRTHYSLDLTRWNGTGLDLSSGRGGIAVSYDDADRIIGNMQMGAGFDPAVSTAISLRHHVNYSYYPGEDIIEVYMFHTLPFCEHWPCPQLGIVAGYENTPVNADGEFSKAASLTLPHWLLVGLLLVAPASWVIRHFRQARRQRYRVAHNLCLTCGYDLRTQKAGAAGGKCPECGTAVTSCVRSSES